MKKKWADVEKLVSQDPVAAWVVYVVKCGAASKEDALLQAYFSILDSRNYMLEKLKQCHEQHF